MLNVCRVTNGTVQYSTSSQSHLGKVEIAVTHFVQGRQATVTIVTRVHVVMAIHLSRKLQK